MSKSSLAPLFLLGFFCLGLLGCENKDDRQQKETVLNEIGIAFLYQTVGSFVDGVGTNKVRAGYSEDGSRIDSYEVDALSWDVGPKVTTGMVEYGDPVFSRLANGDWALTAWTNDGKLVYGENNCPEIDADDVITIDPSSKSTCSEKSPVTGGKSSQVFSLEENDYIFTMSGGEIYLNLLGDSKNKAIDLTSICVLKEPVDSLDELSYGESTSVISTKETINDEHPTGLLLSDTGIAQRSDGTWVLFVKGIDKEEGSACTANTSCELCARNVYRTTSEDLIHWSDLDLVAEAASVPDASTMPDGRVQFYWQDFSIACESSDTNLQEFQRLASRAPISTVYETGSDYALSEPEIIQFLDEDFETDQGIHYATNANPVLLPDSEALKAYEACME